MAGGSHRMERAGFGEMPIEVLEQVFTYLDCFRDLANARQVCKHWGVGVHQAVASRENLSLYPWSSSLVSYVFIWEEGVVRLVNEACNLRELNLLGSRITNMGLHGISLAKCCAHLTSIFLDGMRYVTDKGVVQLVSRTISLQHLSIGCTPISNVSVKAMAIHCPHLKVGSVILRQTLNLWCCHRVTEVGLLALSKGCQQLQFLNISGLVIKPSAIVAILELNSKLKIKKTTLSRVERDFIRNCRDCGVRF